MFVNLPETLKSNGLANPDQLAIDIADECLMSNCAAGFFMKAAQKTN